ncbi:MAG: bifunctional adenosylcobinamide kinase/adenosylcobinamide-phosphate guanylyltransferase, partial [bacterium]
SKGTGGRQSAAGQKIKAGVLSQTVDVSRMGRLLVFLGGIRSGKSALAQEYFTDRVAARRLMAPVYLATLVTGSVGVRKSALGRTPKAGVPAESGGRSGLGGAYIRARDTELAQRVAAHQAARPARWALQEVDGDLPGAAQRCLRAGNDAWLLDGLGAWAALRLDKPKRALAEFEAFLRLASGVPLVTLVLDEVGQGGVPGHPASRAFCDLNGSLNQRACAQADAAWSAQAGLLLRLK